ncbi:MAG: cobalamin-binding protein [Gemmatimonadetes bacterium]|nr:cobalamin-binding protein [Gemmatimonadota bacterium]
MRIASLLPSATEIVHALGLGDQLVAVSHDCDYPAAARGLPVVTKSFVPKEATSGEIDQAVRELRGASKPLYELDFAALEALKPDLILTQALCTVCAVSEEEVHAAAQRLPGPPEVLNLEASTFAGVLDAIRLVAERAGVKAVGVVLAKQLGERAERIAERAARRSPEPMVFLEWLDPPFAAGHWNPELVRWAGGGDPLGRVGKPATAIEWSAVARARPEILFISCCGFGVERALRDVPQLARMPGWREVPAIKNGRVYVADGAAYFSRPGPRLVDSLEIMAHAVAPRWHKLSTGLSPATKVDVPALVAAST